MRRNIRWLLYLGIVVAVVGLGIVHARFIADPPYSYTGTTRFGWSLLYIAILVITAYGLGLPDLPRSPRQALVSAVGAAVFGALAMSVLQLFAGDALLPRFVVFGSAIILLPWYLLCAAMGSLAAAPSTTDRALVVSDSADPAMLRDEISRSPERPVTLVRLLRVADAEWSEGAERPLERWVADDRITVVVLDREAQASPSVVAQVAALHQAGTRIRTLSLFYEEWLGMLPLSELERVSLLFDIGEVHRARYGRFKRVVDIFVATLGAIALVLAIPFVFMANLFANRGPLFFSQDRVGKNGKVFRIHKLRTMRHDADAATNDWTTHEDPRVTPLGRVLRVTHVDELPQVVNILRGDLSVVGPRPEQPRYVAELTEKLPFYDMRHLVRPGLTGWAQVKYGYAGDPTDALEKLQYEFFYLRRQSLALDARIIGRTIRSVLGRQGR